MFRYLRVEILGTLSGSSCVVTTTSSAAVSWSCSTGQLSGSSCIVSNTVSVPVGNTNATDRTLTFTYGPEHQRVRENVVLSGAGTTNYFAGNTWYLNGDDGLDLTYEKEVRTNGTTENRHFLTAGGQAFAVFTSRSGSLPATTTSYFQHDHLGSIAAVTNENGVVVERMAYDPWGKRRNVATLPGTADILDGVYGKTTDRGYTEQEHLDEIGVIHMNGRVYDPLTGRFMSADSIIPNPYDLRAFNRYSYVYNNPLKLFDPTGHDPEGGDDNTPSTPSENPDAPADNTPDNTPAPKDPNDPGTQVAQATLPARILAGPGYASDGYSGIRDRPQYGIDPKTDMPMGTPPSLADRIADRIAAAWSNLKSALGVTKGQTTQSQIQQNHHPILLAQPTRPKI